MRRSVVATLQQLRPAFGGCTEQALPQFSPAFALSAPRQLHVGWAAADAASKGSKPAATNLHDTLQKGGAPNLSSVNHPDGAFNVHDGQPGVTYAMPSYPPTPESVSGIEISPSDNVSKQGGSSATSSSSTSSSGGSGSGAEKSGGGGATEKSTPKPRSTSGGSDSTESSGGGGSSGASSTSGGAKSGSGKPEGLAYIDEQTAKPHLSYATPGGGGGFAKARAPPPDAEAVQEGHAPRMGTPAPAHRPAKYVSSDGAKVAPQAVKAEDYSATSDRSKRTEDNPNITTSS